MAYLPYRMYGNGNFHLPIIDIVQTINSGQSHVCRQTYPMVTCSSRGFSSLRRELEWRKRTDRPLRHFSERKSHSYNYLPKKLILTDGERAKSHKRMCSGPSRSKFFKIRKNAHKTASNRMFSFSSEKDCECLKENKSLKVLFRARRSSGSFDTDGFDEEELDLSLLKNPVEPPAGLKRKGSFVDYIKMKRRKETESFSIDRKKGEDHGDSANM